MPETEEEYLSGYVSRTIAWIHKRHGIPPEFFEKLAKEDDWTFVIKIHAVLETCANQVLVAYFNKPELQKVFARLDMTNPKIGKMAFLSSCDILPKKFCRFIQNLSEIRSMIVHDISHFRFSLPDYLKAMTAEARQQWLKQMHAGDDFEKLPADLKENQLKQTKANPRTAILMNAFFIITICEIRHAQAETREARQKIIDEVLREFPKMRDQPTTKE